MPPKAKKRKQTVSAPEPLPSSGLPVLPLRDWGSKERLGNVQVAFCKIPDELITEIFSYYPAVDALTDTTRSSSTVDDDPILPVEYLVRPSTLRALSQTCIAFRRIFLPILYERLEACVASRDGAAQFFRHAGETLVRKCTGLIENPDLLALVRCVNVILTRYKSDTVLPIFTKCMQAMPNLRTINVLHAHTQMTSHIKRGFEGIVLPTVRTLIIPGYCHELLRCCPEARSVHCTREGGSKLITVIKQKCKKVEEVRDFGLDDNLTKRLVAAAPNLRTIEIEAWIDENTLAHLKKLKRLSTVDILISKYSKPTSDQLAQDITKVKAVLKTSPSTEKKYLRICHRKLSKTGGYVTYDRFELD